MLLLFPVLRIRCARRVTLSRMDSTGGNESSLSILKATISQLLIRGVHPETLFELLFVQLPPNFFDVELCIYYGFYTRKNWCVWAIEILSGTPFLKIRDKTFC